LIGCRVGKFICIPKFLDRYAVAINRRISQNRKLTLALLLTKAPHSGAISIVKMLDDFMLRRSITLHFILVLKFIFPLSQVLH